MAETTDGIVKDFDLSLPKPITDYAREAILTAFCGQVYNDLGDLPPKSQSGGKNEVF